MDVGDALKVRVGVGTVVVGGVVTVTTVEYPL
jgi:hypothetical protein